MTCEQRTMEATDAHTLIQNRAEEWGADATTSEAPFPGAEDVTGYWAQLSPAADGSGLYMTAVARDYMDGLLVFELTGHNGDDEIITPARFNLR